MTRLSVDDERAWFVDMAKSMQLRADGYERHAEFYRATAGNPSLIAPVVDHYVRRAAAFNKAVLALREAARDLKKIDEDALRAREACT